MPNESPNQSLEQDNEVLTQLDPNAPAPMHVDYHRRAEWGHMALTTGGLMPYKVVLHYRGGEQTEHAFETLRSGEAFIRTECPIPTADCGPQRPHGRKALKND